MSTHAFRSIAAVGALLMGMSATTSGQQPAQPAPAPPMAAGCPLEPAQFHACAISKMKAFNPPRTAAGQPNFEGFWNRTIASQDIEDHAAGFGNLGAGPSLVVDTPDRKIPYQPWALKFRLGMADRYLSPLAACHLPGVPRFIYSPGGSRYVQTAEHLVMLLEYSHAHRIIPTTHASPSLDRDVKLWNGQSRGRWEGNTLVVEVTNQNGKSWLDNAGNFYSDELRVVERLTLVDADTLHYETRIEDPKVYTRPWTMAFGFVRNTTPGYELLEEACYEGNRSGRLNDALRPYRGIIPPPN